MCPQGPSLGLLEDSSRRQQTSDVDDEVGNLPGREGMGTQRTATTLTCWPSSTRGGHRTSYQYPSCTGLQQGPPRINTFSGAMPCTGKDRSVHQTVVPWGTMCQGPLPGIGGPGEYCQVIERGSSRYGLLHGSYHKCGPYITEIDHYLWHCGIIWHPDAELLQSYPRLWVWEGPLLCHKSRRDPNQIRLQCPGRMMDLEVQQHLKDHLFHGVHKHIRDSIRYLYSNPRTSYSQLMVAACKVESENKETQEKVKARAAMTTDPGEGTTELGHQIAKLMATLARAGQQPNQHPK